MTTTVRLGKKISMMTMMIVSGVLSQHLLLSKRRKWHDRLVKLILYVTHRRAPGPPMIQNLRRVRHGDLHHKKKANHVRWCRSPLIPQVHSVSPRLPQQAPNPPEDRQRINMDGLLVWIGWILVALNNQSRHRWRHPDFRHHRDGEIRPHSASRSRHQRVQDRKPVRAARVPANEARITTQGPTTSQDLHQKAQDHKPVKALNVLVNETRMTTQDRTTIQYLHQRVQDHEPARVAKALVSPVRITTQDLLINQSLPQRVQDQMPTGALKALAIPVRINELIPLINQSLLQ